MSLRINTNVSAINTHSHLTGISQRYAKSVERLSSGLRINRAADDAAGLTISEKLRRQVRGLGRATLNAQDGISMIQSAEGALNETHSILHRMRELAIQSANDTLTSKDRLEIQKEVIQLRDELNRIAYNTEFNTKKLLDGSQSAWTSTSSLHVKALATGAVPVGGDYQVSLALLQAGVSQMQRTGIFTLVDSPHTLASADTKLASIASMYDANGVFVLDTPQTLTLHGNTRSAEVYLDSQVTLDELASRLQWAMTNEKEGLGMENSRAKHVSTVQSMVSGLGGYLELVSGFVGKDGIVSVAGDQALIDALSISTTREASDNHVEVSVVDPEKNRRTTQVSSDRASGLLDGVDIVFKSQPAQIAGSKGLVQGLHFTSAESFMIDAGGQTIVLVVEEGYWTMEGLVRNFNYQISTVSGPVSIEGLQANLVDDEVRFSYRPPMDVAKAFGSNLKVTNAGPASTLGIVNGNYSAVINTERRAESVNYGFSKYMSDVASGEMTALEIGDGVKSIVVNISNTIGTANGTVTAGDMVDFNSLKARINSDLEAAGVGVRLDQADNTMMFTSTRIGKENLGATTYNLSEVSIMVATVTGAVASASEALLRMFNIDTGARYGHGDTNFNLHVKNINNQYHIGANQNEIMNVSMSDMSAAALGVDNLDMTNVAGAERAIRRLNVAIDKVSAERSKLGAFQNRLEYAITNLRNMHGNAVASESRIRDTDMASEMIEFTRNQVMNESANAMLAQANSRFSGLLNLLM